MTCARCRTASTRRSCSKASSGPLKALAQTEFGWTLLAAFGAPRHRSGDAADL